MQYHRRINVLVENSCLQPIESRRQHIARMRYSHCNPGQAQVPFVVVREMVEAVVAYFINIESKHGKT